MGNVVVLYTISIALQINYSSGFNRLINNQNTEGLSLKVHQLLLKNNFPIVKMNWVCSSGA